MDFNTSSLEYLNILNPIKIYRNLPVPQLIEKALASGEGVLSSTGALCVKTGKYTGNGVGFRCKKQTCLFAEETCFPAFCRGIAAGGTGISQYKRRDHCRSDRSRQGGKRLYF